MIVNIQNLNDEDCKGCPFLESGYSSRWICKINFNVYNNGYDDTPLRPQECRDTNVKLYDTMIDRGERK